MNKEKHSSLPLVLLTGIGIVLSGASVNAAAFVTTGQTVTGTTEDLNLNTSSGSPFSASAGVTLANDISGNLEYTPPATDSWVNWQSLSLASATYQYVQVDFASADAGVVSSQWQTFWLDSDNATLGSTGHTVGNPDVSTGPFSVVLDMTAGTNGGLWGPGNVTQFRLDMFEGSAINNGKTFTISAVTFGSALTPIPESSAALLSGLSLLVLLRRRR